MAHATAAQTSGPAVPSGGSERTICEEFRASATFDYEQDEADRGNRKITCAMLFLWSQQGSLAKLYDDPLAIWREWADDVRGSPVPVGHFIPEEAPEETTRQLFDFLN